MEGSGFRRPKIYGSGTLVKNKNNSSCTQCTEPISRNFAGKVKSKIPWQGWLRGRGEAGWRGLC
jgi:hypothetical protein